MASHLTITSTAPGSLATRGFASQEAPAQAGGALGVFAALLGQSQAEQAAGKSQAAASELSHLVSVGLDGAFNEGEGDAADPEALAALGQVLVPTAPADPAPVVNLFDALTRVKASLDAGEPLNADLLAAVETALADLAEALGLDLETLPVPVDFAALLDSTADDTGLAGTLAQLLAPFAASVAAANKATQASAIAGEATANSQLKAVGDKLAAMLAALHTGDIADEKLAAIGMPPGQPLDADIEAALARFTAGLAAQATVPKEPELATPILKLTEPVLAGKSDAPEALSPAARSENPDASARLDAASDKPGDKNNGRDRPEPAQRDTRPAAAFVTPAGREATPAESQASAVQTGSPRIDSGATNRVVVQAGYQTSQQQLNLPQIAFELGRQIEGGNTRFQIRLDPPELGRIDVRMEIDRAGNVSARLTVEKSETLDLMQRDQRGLERALQQAGVDAGKTSLEFSLKQNPFAGQNGTGDGHNGRGPEVANDNGTTDDPAEPAPTVNLYRGSLQASGINIIA